MLTKSFLEYYIFVGMLNGFGVGFFLGGGFFGVGFFCCNCYQFVMLVAMLLSFHLAYCLSVPVITTCI